MGVGYKLVKNRRVKMSIRTKLLLFVLCAFLANILWYMATIIFFFQEYFGFQQQCTRTVTG